MTDEIKIQPSPNHPGWAMWRDPDGVTLEFEYVVTQFDHEGPEYLEYRPFFNGIGEPVPWVKIDPTGEYQSPLTEELDNALEEFFHGPLIETRKD